MKRILLCTDGSAFAQSIYRYGAWVSAQFSASVDVLYVTDARGQSTANNNLSGSIGLGAAESLLKQLVEVEHERAKLNHQRAKLILDDAQQVLTQHHAQDIRLIHKTGFLVDFLEALEAESDLIVLGKRGEAAEFASGHLGANVERIVRASQKPCLVTPQIFSPPERLVLAYDGSPTSHNLLTFLMNASSLHALEIHLVMVAKSEADSGAFQTLDRAAEKLKGVGIQPVVSLPIGEPEKAIAHYIEAHNISLVLMGAYGHRRIRHLVLGSTAMQLLRSSQVPVLIFR